MFQKKDPFLVNCENNECNPCVSSNKRINELSHCKTDNVCYSAKCTNCEKEGKTKVYFGETSRNLHIRSQEHINLYKNKSSTSFMYKHVSSDHQNSVQDVVFDFKVEGKFKKPLQRQLFEAKCIENTPSNSSLNTKDEFNYQSIRKLDLKTAEKIHHCNICGQTFTLKNKLNDHDEKFHRKYPCDLCGYESYGSRGLMEHMKTHTRKT